MEDISNYNKLRLDSEEFYSHVGKIFSPCFKDNVYFNSEGFNHIVFKNPRSERDKNSQILRFKLLPIAVKLIDISTTYQEYEQTLVEFKTKIYKKRTKRTKLVRYWGIIAILEGRKIKVIVRKIGEEGNLHFWSVIPAWVTNKYRDIKLFTTMKGRPEED